MVRTYTRKTKNKSWSTEAMAKAVSSVLAGKMGCTLAARTFSLPKTTLERRVKKARILNGVATTQTTKTSTLANQKLTYADLMPSEACVKYENYDDNEWGASSNDNDNVTAYAPTPDLQPVASHQHGTRFALHKKAKSKQIRVVEPTPNSYVPAARDEVSVMPTSAPPQPPAQQNIEQQASTCNSSTFVAQLPMDGIEHLFLGLAKTIKTFSARRQVLAKMHITQYVMEQELQQQDDEMEGEDDGGESLHGQ